MATTKSRPRKGKPDKHTTPSEGADGLASLSEADLSTTEREFINNATPDTGASLKDRILVAIKCGNQKTLNDVVTGLKDEIPQAIMTANGGAANTDQKAIDARLLGLVGLAAKALVNDGYVKFNGADASGQLTGKETIQLVPPEADERFEIDEEFKNLLPPPSLGELAGLERAILVDGCRDPLTIWESDDRSILIDGHTRQEICLRHRKSYEIASINLPSREAVIEWIWNNHYGKRNFTPEAESYVRGKRFNSLERERGGDRQSDKAKSQNETLKRTGTEVAAMYKVARATIFRDGKYAEALDTIAKDCGGDVRRKILSRALRLTRSNVQMLAAKDENKRKRLVKALLDGKKASEVLGAKAKGSSLWGPDGKTEDQVQWLNKKLGEAGARELAEALLKKTPSKE